MSTVSNLVRKLVNKPTYYEWCRDVARLCESSGVTPTQVCVPKTLLVGWHAQRVRPSVVVAALKQSPKHGIVSFCRDVLDHMTLLKARPDDFERAHRPDSTERG